MKNLAIILTFTILFFASCSKKDEETKANPIFALPPETQIGANTFGVTIRGKVYIPRTPTGVNVGVSPRAVYFWGSSNNSWNEIEVKDGASPAGFKMILHLQNLETIGVGKYNLKQSNFHQGIDSPVHNHIYFSIWDANINNYAYYGSIENQAEINITKFSGSLTSNWILSGNFNGNFVRYDNPNDIIYINDGRFDLNLNSISTHPFP